MLPVDHHGHTDRPARRGGTAVVHSRRGAAAGPGRLLVAARGNGGAKLKPTGAGREPGASFHYYTA